MYYSLITAIQYYFAYFYDYSSVYLNPTLAVSYPIPENQGVQSIQLQLLQRFRDWKVYAILLLGYYTRVPIITCLYIVGQQF